MEINKIQIIYSMSVIDVLRYVMYILHVRTSLYQEQYLKAVEYLEFAEENKI